MLQKEYSVCTQSKAERNNCTITQETPMYMVHPIHGLRLPKLPQHVLFFFFQKGYILQHLSLPSFLPEREFLENYEQTKGDIFLPKNFIDCYNCYNYLQERVVRNTCSHKVHNPSFTKPNCNNPSH